MTATTLDTKEDGWSHQLITNLMRCGLVVTAERPCGGGTIWADEWAYPKTFGVLCEVLREDGFEIADGTNPDYPIVVGMNGRREIPFWRAGEGETVR